MNKYEKALASIEGYGTYTNETDTTLRAGVGTYENLEKDFNDALSYTWQPEKYIMHPKVEKALKEDLDALGSDWGFSGNNYSVGYDPAKNEGSLEGVTAKQLEEGFKLEFEYHSVWDELEQIEKEKMEALTVPPEILEQCNMKSGTSREDVISHITYHDTAIVDGDVEDIFAGATWEDTKIDVSIKQQAGTPTNRNPHGSYLEDIAGCEEHEIGDEVEIGVDVTCFNLNNRGVSVLKRGLIGTVIGIIDDYVRIDVSASQNQPPNTYLCDIWYGHVQLYEHKIQEQATSNNGYSTCQFGCGCQTERKELFSSFADVCPKCGK